MNDTNPTSVLSGGTSVYGSIAGALDLYSPPVLIAIGVTCNVLVICVMRLPYFKHVSTSLYMCTNAVVDNASLLVAFPPHWIHVNFPRLIFRGEHAHFLCKLFNFVGWGTSNLGIVLTAAMTVERAIAVTFPLHASALCTKRRAKYATVALLIFISIKDAHFLLKSTMAPLEFETQLCVIDTSDPYVRYYAKTVWPIIQHVFLFVTFAFIIVSNVMIIKQTHSITSLSTSLRTSYRQNGNGNQLTNPARSNQMKTLTIMLLIDSLSVMVCTLPLTLLHLINPQFSDPEIGNMLFSIGFFLVYVNRCGNFFLYCMSGQRFRTALRLLVCGGARNLPGGQAFFVTQASRSAGLVLSASDLNSGQNS
ncbi:cysteinyl leukotriene receptor 1-like [Mya arenaria]|uniref:cysteinyl leukotriene receptor 1-like n=1 Tax=Mya arenaria TaxID=6604 RepID=UPI0022E44415|nr:cysteinyl leukotriene receptor 1-like [Mya arenaria]